MMFFGKNKFFDLDKRSNPKTGTEPYKNMKKKQIAKRRAKNKVACRSRRINKLRMV